MVTYRTVRVPEDLVKTILTLIKIDNELGYRSHSEFIIEATRRRIEQLEQLKKINSNFTKKKNSDVKII